MNLRSVMMPFLASDENIGLHRTNIAEWTSCERVAVAWHPAWKVMLMVRHNSHNTINVFNLISFLILFLQSKQAAVDCCNESVFIFVLPLIVVQI